MAQTTPTDRAPTPAATAPGADPRARRARVATATVFAIHGALVGTFGARVPWIAEHTGVGVGGLGVALLMPGIGATLAMPLSGRIVHRFDLRAVVTVLMLLWCAALTLPTLPTSLLTLCLVLPLYGAASGISDVAMNAHAVLVERRYGRSIMSGLHGWWSVGGLLGSAVAALAARAGVDARAHFLAVTLTCGALTLLASRWLLRHRPEPELNPPPAFALPSRAVLPMGLVGLCAVIAEASGLEWSAVYLHDELDATASAAALTVAMFSISMAVARFAGDSVVRRLGPVTTVRAAGLCATIGALTVVLATGPIMAFAGFALLGVGIAVVVPLVFAAAGRVGDHPGRSLAGVAGIAYGSGLIAPGAIGGVAHLSSLTVSFTLIVALTALMAAGAGTLRARHD